MHASARDAHAVSLCFLPLGSAFADNIQSLLSIELCWIGWKHHTRCSTVVLPASDLATPATLNVEWNKKKRKAATQMIMDPMTGLPVPAPEPRK